MFVRKSQVVHLDGKEDGEERQVLKLLESLWGPQ